MNLSLLGSSDILIMCVIHCSDCKTPADGSIKISSFFSVLSALISVSNLSAVGMFVIVFLCIESDYESLSQTMSAGFCENQCFHHHHLVSCTVFETSGPRLKRLLLKIDGAMLLLTVVLFFWDLI